MSDTAPFPVTDSLSEYESDYLFDLLGYRILPQALSAETLRAINEWIDYQPPRVPGDWFDNIEVHSYQGHDGTNYQNVIEGGTVRCGFGRYHGAAGGHVD